MANSRDWSASFASASIDALSFYDEIMVPRIFDPWATFLLDQIQPRSGQSALDVACGPGTVTRNLALRVGPSGRAVGCDLSPTMLDIARSKPSASDCAPIEYLECPADALRVPDDSFDVVTCQQGLQFFSDRPAALVEMRRALRPGGRLGVAVWASIEDCPPFAALATGLGQVLGADTAKVYEGGPWGFSDADSLAQLVADCGFTDVTVRREELPLVFEGGPEQLLLTLQAASVAPALAQLSESDQAALASAVARAARPITFEGEIRSHATSNIVTARVAK